MKHQKGQVVIILLLTIIVALSIGLSISTRSINEVSTATRVEQSSRAYTAAQAGIEKALQNIQSNQAGTAQISDFTNQSTANITTSVLLPVDGTQGIEFGSSGVTTDVISQVWLADPTTLSASYTQPSFSVYFGNTTQSNLSDYPAIEVQVITRNGTSYQSQRYYFDTNSSRAASNNHFSGCTSSASVPINTIISSQSTFYCQAVVSGYKSSSSVVPIMARIRLLYSTSAQKLAVMPIATDCSAGTSTCALPPQVRVLTSIGTAGSTQRKIQVLTQDYVMPSFLDFALLSPGDLTHN